MPRGTEVSSSRNVESKLEANGSGINSSKPNRTGLNPNYDDPEKIANVTPRLNFISGNEFKRLG